MGIQPETEKQKLQKLLDGVKAVLGDIDLGRVIELADKIKDCLKNGGKLLVFGNGGSASDAQHLAAELIVRFEKNRKPFAAVALNANTAVITAIGNDFGFDNIFARQVEALAQKKDLVVAISTSGSSLNVLKGVEAAKKIGCCTACLTGAGGGELGSLVDICFNAPSARTADIQVCHIIVIHLLCGLLESELTGA